MVDASTPVFAGKVHPMLFNGPMVRAILREIKEPGSGKTITRRIITPSPKPEWTGCTNANMGGRNDWWDFWGLGTTAVERRRIPYSVGDLLWVRETWATVNSGAGPGWAFRADGEFVQPEYDSEDFGVGPSFNYDKYPGKYSMWYSDLMAGSPDHAWVPSIHMHRWASRLTLHVTEVTVERLRDITEDDAKREGCDPPVNNGVVECGRRKTTFASLWDSTKLKPGFRWEDNPWVSVIRFRPELANVDGVLARLGAKEAA